MVKILYFMKLVETLGCSQEEVDVPAEVVNVAGLLAWLGQRGEKYRLALADGRNLQVTINKKFVDTASPIGDGDEVAFFPKSR